MNIQLSSIDNAPEIFKIYQDCKRAMELENIFQWTESYPSIDIITKDINNTYLYELNDRGKCLGVINLSSIEEPEYSTIEWSDRGGNFLVVHRLAISPVYQSQGWAKKLMLFAEEYALENNFSSIRLDAYSGNEKALRLYENGGYKKMGEVKFPGRDLPFFCYEKIIFRFNDV